MEVAVILLWWLFCMFVSVTVAAMMASRWPDLWPTDADAIAALRADYPPNSRYVADTIWDGGCEHLVLRLA